MDTYPEWPNLATMMFDRAASWSERPMLHWHDRTAWRQMSWGRFARLTAACARGLRQAGVGVGDRVVLLSENRPEWPIAETALLAIGAVPVPAYTTNTRADHAHVLEDSGARVAIVSTPALAGQLAAAGPLDLMVQIEPGEHPAVSRATSWADVLRNPDDPPDDVMHEARAITPDRLACIIYTSGTAGAPRGVMLPHRSLLANCRSAAELVRPLRLKDDLYLSFLPAAHSFEHLVGGFFLPSMGVEIVYSRGVEHIASDMLATRPTVMTVVPRLLEVIRARILAQVAREPAWRRAMFAAGMRLGERRAAGERLPPPMAALDAALDRLVRRKVRARFGGRFRAAMSGGARLEPEVGRFFQALGIVLMQGYGQTEAGPVISANPGDRVRIETVGPPLSGVQVRIAEDGEILVRGDLVMDGYWQRPDETRAVLRDGWLHTGDLGTVDPDGYLRITDRKRDMIVLSGGENVSPARVEGFLMACPHIAQAVVFGEGRAGLAALIVPAEGCDERAVAACVADANKRLSVHERVRRHAIVPPFTVENSLLTATQKVRRRRVLELHAQTVATLI